jgi:hypothetical protein
MDHRTARMGLARRPAETLTRFAARLESDTGDAEAARWYADYASARYGPADLPTIEALRSRLNTLGPPPRRPREAIGAS